MKCSVRGCEHEVTQVSGFTPRCYYHLYNVPLPVAKSKPKPKRKMKAAPENKALLVKENKNAD